MESAPLPPNEDERLEALRQTGVLDTPPEPSFDRLTALAAKVCGAPIALISLVDKDRQWFKSKVGLDACETPRDVSFCAFAILQGDTMVVRDTLEDVRFADNPLVTDSPKIRFYAGDPLVTYDGKALGTFCVIDKEPRDLDVKQIGALRALSIHATAILDLHRTKALLEANGAEWESRGEDSTPELRAHGLSKLGEDFKSMVEARERAELSFRELERDLGNVDRISGNWAWAANPEVDQLLGEIVKVSDRMLLDLGPQHSLQGDAARIGATARRAREKLAGM